MVYQILSHTYYSKMLNTKLKRSTIGLNKPVYHRNKNAKNIATRKNAKVFTIRTGTDLVLCFSLIWTKTCKTFFRIFAVGIAIKKNNAET